MNKEIKKHLRPKNSVPNIESAEKLIYIAVLQYMNIWQQRILRGFAICKNDLMEMFERY